jgi:hypothetical protein
MGQWLENADFFLLAQYEWLRKELTTYLPKPISCQPDWTGAGARLGGWGSALKHRRVVSAGRRIG